MANGALTNENPGGEKLAARVFDVAITILSLGTNKLVKSGSGWLRRKGLTAYVLPVLLLNEGFGAYRAYMVTSSSGLW